MIRFYNSNKEVNNKQTGPRRPVTPGRYGIRPQPLGAVLLVLAAGAGLYAVPAQASELSGKADLFLTRKAAQHPGHGWTAVIVKFSGDLTPERQAHLKALHADIYRHLDIIHSVAVNVPTRNLEQLAALPFVQHLSADGGVKKNDSFTTGSSLATTAWAAPYNASGAGVTVAIVDSGIKGIDDLGSRILASVSYATDPNGNTLAASDDCGHGTHVAGIVAGNGANSTGPQYTQTFYGIAPQANLVNARVLNSEGQGTVSSVIAGIQWVVSNRSAYNIRVMNLSLGHPAGESYTADPLCQAVEAAWQASIVVVCAAGNDGRLNATSTTGAANEGYDTAYGSIESPGNDPYVITVGAMKSMDGKRADDRIATYSSRGPSRLDLILKPDIVAPGNRVISLNVPNGYLDVSYGATNDVAKSVYHEGKSPVTSADYFTLSGTSMATPVISGAAALMLQANPNLSPDTIKARLMLSADKWTDPTGNSDPCTYGAGYVNIPAALQCTAVATQSALSPSLLQDAGGNVYINTNSALWGTRALWGTGITDLRAVWGTRALWGTSTNLLNASRAIWGTAVWTDNAVWGSTTAAADLSTTVIAGE